MVCASLPFFAVVVFRVVVLFTLLGDIVSPFGQSRRQLIADGDLPFYSVLVPLFREAATCCPGWFDSLAALDYPPAKLEVMLVLEAIDLETQAALLDDRPARQLPHRWWCPTAARAPSRRRSTTRCSCARGELRRRLRCRGPPGARPAAPRAGQAFGRRAPGSSACRPSSTSTTPRTAGSRASSRSSTRRCSTPSCRRWSGCGCRSRSAARRITFPRATLLDASAAGTPTT